MQPEVFAPVAGSTLRAPPLRAPVPQRRVSIADFFSPPARKGAGAAVHSVGASTGRKRASLLAPASASAEPSADAAEEAEAEDAAVAVPPSSVKRARTSKGARFLHVTCRAAHSDACSQRLPCATRWRACCTASSAAPSLRRRAPARFPSTPMRLRGARPRAARPARRLRRCRRRSRTPWPGGHPPHRARCCARYSHWATCRSGWRKPPRSR